MDDFKIEYFKADYPDRAPPYFRRFNEGEVLAVQNRLQQLILGQPGVYGRALAEIAAGKLSFKRRLDLNQDNYGFTGLFTDLGLRPNKSIIVDWQALTAPIEVYWADFERYFEYFWYPCADDLWLFDDSFSWLALCDHEGDLFIMEPKVA